MRPFLHNLSNSLAILHGKVKQAERLLGVSIDSTQVAQAKEKMVAALREAERMTTLISAEKAELERETENL